MNEHAMNNNFPIDLVIHGPMYTQPIAQYIHTK